MTRKYTKKTTPKIDTQDNAINQDTSLPTPEKASTASLQTTGEDASTVSLQTPGEDASTASLHTPGEDASTASLQTPQEDVNAPIQTPEKDVNAPVGPPEANWTSIQPTQENQQNNNPPNSQTSSQGNNPMISIHELSKIQQVPQDTHISHLVDPRRLAKLQQLIKDIQHVVETNLTSQRETQVLITDYNTYVHTIMITVDEWLGLEIGHWTRGISHMSRDEVVEIIKKGMETTFENGSIGKYSDTVLDIYNEYKEEQNPEQKQHLLYRAANEQVVNIFKNRFYCRVNAIVNLLSRGGAHMISSIPRTVKDLEPKGESYLQDLVSQINKIIADLKQQHKPHVALFIINHFRDMMNKPHMTMSELNQIHHGNQETHNGNKGNGKQPRPYNKRQPVTHYIQQDPLHAQIARILRETSLSKETIEILDAARKILLFIYRQDQPTIEPLADDTDITQKVPDFSTIPDTYGDLDSYARRKLQIMRQLGEDVFSMLIRLLYMELINAIPNPYTCDMTVDFLAQILTQIQARNRIYTDESMDTWLAQHVRNAVACVQKLNLVNTKKSIDELLAMAV